MHLNNRNKLDNIKKKPYIRVSKGNDFFNKRT